MRFILAKLIYIFSLLGLIAYAIPSEVRCSPILKEKKALQNKEKIIAFEPIGVINSYGGNGYCSQWGAYWPSNMQPGVQQQPWSYGQPNIHPWFYPLPNVQPGGQQPRTSEQPATQPGIYQPPTVPPGTQQPGVHGPPIIQPNGQQPGQPPAQPAPSPSETPKSISVPPDTKQPAPVAEGTASVDTKLQSTADNKSIKNGILSPEPTLSDDIYSGKFSSYASGGGSTIYWKILSISIPSIFLILWL